MKEFERRGIESGFDAPLYVSAYARELPSSQARGCWVRKFPKTGRLFSLIGDLWAWVKLPNSRVIYHETYYKGLRESKSRNAKVVTVHDCIHEVFPEYFDPRDPALVYRKECLDRADQIICISKNTKADLIRFYRVPEEKLNIVSLGVLPRPRRTNVARKDFLLFVGHRNLYKNAKTLIEAYALSEARRSGVRLIFFGGGNFDEAEVKLIADTGIQDLVVCTHGNDDALSGYYSDALAFVFPSEYEGFGLPTLEAMSHGCPVICSNSSSFPEVAGEGALYFSPKDHLELQRKIDLIFRDSKLREDMIEKGYQNVTRFSWQRCAEETLKVYERALARSLHSDSSAGV